MKIALVAPFDYYESEGPKNIPQGSVVYTHGLAQALMTNGHDVTVLTSSFRDRTVDGVRVVALPQKSDSDLAWSEQVHTWLLDNRQDVVEAHQVAAPLMVEQLVGGTPTVVRYASDLIDNVTAGRYNYIEDRAQLYSQHLLDMLTVVNADLVVCGGKASAVRAEIQGAKAVVELPLGTELEGAPKKFPKRPSVLVKIDRFMDERKGGEFIYPILANIPEEIPVVILGSDLGINPSELVARAPREAQWIFTPVDEKALDILYRDACCVVVPTKSESFGLSLLEPLKHGRPVVCFDLPDPSKQGWPLWRIGKPSPQAFTQLPQVIAQAMKPEKGLATGLHKFAEQFFWGNLVDNYEQTYRTAIARSLAKGRTRGW